MADRQITVVINGQEFVSKAASSAAGGMDGFASKVPGWVKTAGIVAGAFVVVKEAVERVAAVVMSGITAYDNYAAAKGRLAAQAKLTGIPLADLTKIADDAKDKFGLSTVAASELAGAVGKFSAKAGDSSKAAGLMTAALDLGAASGMNASEIAEGLSSALAGNDEWLNRLGLANPSQLWKDYAAANGRAVGTLTDTEQKLAVMTAIMDAGNTVAGTYAKRMETGAGAQDQLNNKLDDAKVKFGEAIQPLRIFITQGLGAFVEFAGRVLLAVGRVANAFGVVLVGAFQGVRSVLGDVAEGLGRLTGSQALEDWGKRQAKAFPEFLAALEKMEKKTDDTTEATKKMAKAHVTSTEDSKKALKEYNEELERRHKLMLDTIKMLYDGIVTSTQAAERLGPALQKSMEPARFAGFNTVLENSRKLGDELVKKMGELGGPIPPLVKKSEDAVGTLAGRVSDVTENVLAVGREFGGLDKDVEAVIGTTGKLAESVKSLLTGGVSFAGVAGIMGAVGGMVSLLQADSREQKQLQRESAQRLKENTDQAAKLTKEMGLLTLDMAGGEVATIEALLEDIVPKLAKGGDVFTGPNSLASILNGATSTLVSNGMGWDTIVELSKKFGMNILDSRGAIDFAQLGPLLQVLRGTNTAAPGKGFDAQLSMLKTGFDINNTGALGQLAGLFGLGGTFSSTLRGVFNPKDLAGSRIKLTDLFNDMAAGKLTEAQLGGLSGTQFLGLITDLIARLDDAMGAPAGGGSEKVGGTGALVGENPMEELARTTTDVSVPLFETMAENSERIALATEGTWAELEKANAKLDTLITVTDGRFQRLDAELAAARLSAALSAGVGPVF